MRGMGFLNNSFKKYLPLPFFLQEKGKRAGVMGCSLMLKVSRVYCVHNIEYVLTKINDAPYF